MDFAQETIVFLSRKSPLGASTPLIAHLFYLHWNCSIEIPEHYILFFAHLKFQDRSGAIKEWQCPVDGENVWWQSCVQGVQGK
jgi:hypothetical protein